MRIAFFCPKRSVLYENNVFHTLRFCDVVGESEEENKNIGACRVLILVRLISTGRGKKGEQDK